MAASWDWNKVIRADYGDITYARLALEAADIWRDDPLWKPFFHPVGAVWIGPGAFSAKLKATAVAAGVDSSTLTAHSVEEARKLYDGHLSEARYDGVDEVIWNRASGWADAKGALQKIIETAVGLGVKYVAAEVSAVEFDDSGAAIGVRTAEGEQLLADKVILSSGAYTAVSHDSSRHLIPERLSPWTAA